MAMQIRHITMVDIPVRRVREGDIIRAGDQLVMVLSIKWVDSGHTQFTVFDGSGSNETYAFPDDGDVKIMALVQE